MTSMGARITSTPDVCGGESCIRGTRIMVWLLVYLCRGGRSDNELLQDYPGITLEDLDAAWEYYRRNPSEIEQATWSNTIAANYAPETAVPLGELVYARLIGMTESQIREAFDPPLGQQDLDAAWEQYRRHPEVIDRYIAQTRRVA